VLCFIQNPLSASLLRLNGKSQVDEQGKKVKNSEIPITNDGTYEGYKSLLLI
jgi:hypothetical protein